MEVEFRTGLGRFVVVTDDHGLEVGKGRIRRRVPWVEVERAFVLEGPPEETGDVPGEVLDTVVPGLGTLHGRTSDHQVQSRQLFVVRRRGRRRKSWYATIPAGGPEGAAVMAELHRHLGARLEPKEHSILQARRAAGLRSAHLVIGTALFLVVVAAAVFAIWAVRSWLGI